MLDRILKSHLDKQDELEEGLEKDIDRLVDNINIDEVLKNPAAAIASVAMSVSEILYKDYAPQSVRNGSALAKSIEKAQRPIIIPNDDQNKS